MAFRIEKKECIGCGACEGVCPVKCISEEEGTEKRVINEANCIDCGSCAGICPVACIFQL